MYRFGNMKHSENVHKQMMVDKFALFDQVFKALVSDLNSDSSQRVKQKCLKEIEIETASPNPSYKSYLLRHLVQDMFDMVLLTVNLNYQLQQFTCLISANY